VDTTAVKFANKKRPSKKMAYQLYAGTVDNDARILTEIGKDNINVVIPMLENGLNSENFNLQLASRLERMR
jgi:hypothetical protein